MMVYDDFLSHLGNFIHVRNNCFSTPKSREWGTQSWDFGIENVV